jgi:hypothetical protein
VKVSVTKNDCEPPPPGVLVVRRRLLIVGFAVPVTVPRAVIVNVRSTYSAEELIADPPAVVVPDILVHVPTSVTVPIAYDERLDPSDEKYSADRTRLHCAAVPPAVPLLLSTARAF